MKSWKKPESRLTVGVDKRLLQSVRGPYDQTEESDHDILLHGTNTFIDRILIAGYKPPIQDHWTMAPKNDKLTKRVILTVSREMEERLSQCARQLKVSRIFVVRAALYDLSRTADLHFKGERRY